MGLLSTVARSDRSLFAEVLVLRHENAVLRRQIARVRFEPAWHRRLVARKYTPSRRPPGRPATKPAVKVLILRMAQDNPQWGLVRITGELIKLGHRIAKSTIWQILHDAGIGPAPRRSGLTWTQFLTTQARTVIATDFLHVDTVLLRRLYVLMFSEHGTRRIHIARITANPDGASTAQQARNLAMALGENLEAMRFLIRDRSGQSTEAFNAVFHDCGLRILRGPPHAPRANAICERLVGTLGREVLDHLLILNQTHLRTVLTEYTAHYTTARPHQGIDQHVPDDDPDQPAAKIIDFETARIHRKQVLDGLTSEYQIVA